MIQSRSNPLKKGRMSEQPSPVVGLVTQKARIHTELQTEQSALFCLQNPKSCFLVIVLLEASIFLCISEDCDFQSSLGKDGVGMEKQVVVHCGLADLSLWTALYRQSAGHSVFWADSRSWIPLVCFVRESVSSYPTGSNIWTTMSHRNIAEQGKKKHWGYPGCGHANLASS